MTESELESSVALLRRAQDGDAAALGVLYRRYFARLSRWSAGRLSPAARHMEDTSDIVQDVLVRLFSSPQEIHLRNDGALMAYARAAILNRLRTAARRAARRPDGQATTLGGQPLRSPLPSPLEQHLGADSVGRYEDALARLDEDERSAVILKVEMDYGNAEIAAALQSSSVDAARMFTHRAIAKLVRIMEDP